MIGTWCEEVNELNKSEQLCYEINETEINPEPVSEDVDINRC